MSGILRNHPRLAIKVGDLAVEAAADHVHHLGTEAGESLGPVHCLGSEAGESLGLVHCPGSGADGGLGLVQETATALETNRTNPRRVEDLPHHREVKVRRENRIRNRSHPRRH